MNSSTDATAPTTTTTTPHDTEPRNAPSSEPIDEPSPSRREQVTERFLTAHYPFGFQAITR